MIIQTVAVFAICSIGLGANACALFVLLNSSIIKSTTGIYLSFLAVFDGLVLVTQLVFSFSNVIKLSNIACKSFWVVRVPVITISCYILVIMTTEKCYFLVNTYKPKPTRKQALKIATISAVVITLVLGTQVGITSGLVSLPVDGTFGNASSYIAHDNNFPVIGNETIFCDVLPRYNVYSNHLLRLIRLISIVFTRIVAPIIVIICNLIIIRSLRKYAMQVAPLDASSTVNDKRITKLLIIVSLSFALLTLPFSFYILILRFFYGNNLAEGMDPENLVHQVVINCLLINHSINYFLYILSSKTVRKEAMEAFKSLFII